MEETEGDCLNTEMLSEKYNNFHHKDKTVLWASYDYNGNLIPGKTVFILKQGHEIIKIFVKSNVCLITKFSDVTVMIMETCSHTRDQFRYVPSQW